MTRKGLGLEIMIEGKIDKVIIKVLTRGKARAIAMMQAVVAKHGSVECQ